jgi:hypothetical protein
MITTLHTRRLNRITTNGLSKDMMMSIYRRPLMNCELCNGVGWIDTFNTQEKVQEIQKCDDCNIFKDDEQAKKEQDNE